MAEPAAMLLPATNATEAALSISKAAYFLKQGGLVAFPTETVYGLGASALSDHAAQKIYKAKGRPSDNPLIVHVSSEKMAFDLLPGGSESVPELYKPLIKRFWPGPLSLIFPLDAAADNGKVARRQVANTVTAGQASVAIRMPFHPLAISLIAAADLPLAAPSANLSSRPSPTAAHHVLNDLGTDRGLDAVLDGGPCNVGLESTVVDLVRSDANPQGQLRVLRAGGISANELESCLAEAGHERAKVQVYARDFRSKELESRPTTPGMKYKHYAPHKAQAFLISQDPDARTLVGLIESAAADKDIALMITDDLLRSLAHETVPQSPAMYRLSSPHPPVLVYPLGKDSVSAAHALFAGMRELDDMDVDEIWVQLMQDEDGVGLAVNERMSKAAAGRVIRCSF